MRLSTRDSAPPTIRELLKDGTKAHHARAEASLPLMDEALTLDRYRDILARLLGFYAPLEQRLADADWDRIGLDAERRRKTPLLLTDLRALGLGDEEIVALPLCADPPDARSLSDALGCLYVLEGATLGGQLVRRHLAAHLGLGPHNGCAFFAAYGDAVGPMWREYQQRLAMLVDGGAAASEDVVDAARRTFDALTHWLNTPTPLHGV